MAELICKANLFPGACKYNQNGDKHHGVSVFSKSCVGFRSSTSFPSVKLGFQSLGSNFNGRRIVLKYDKGLSWKGSSQAPIKAQALRIGTVQKWWEKGLQANMKEVTSAQDLVDSLMNAGDKLVVVDFFSPGCTGCRALHPKICQLAEMNPEVQFLQVNYEEHKSMCYSLGVHVLPFFRFYRGAHGRLCSFSCTNATIKKFKDALAKHLPDRCSLAPTKGLEEKELLALAANKDLNFTYTPKPSDPKPVPVHKDPIPEAVPPSGLKSNSDLQSLIPSMNSNSKTSEDANERSLAMSGR